MRLEPAFAEYVGVSAGILCQSGWDASVGLLQSVANPDAKVYVDMLAYTSLWEPARAAVNRNGPGIIKVNSLYRMIYGAW